MTKEEVLKNYRVGEILEAARRVIGRFGFEGTTIDRVAEEARIAKGTIYLYFTNKDDLLHASVMEGLRELTLDLQRNDKVSAPPIERISGGRSRLLPAFLLKPRARPSALHSLTACHIKTC